MHRLLVATDELSQESPALSRAAAQHLKVLRPKDGEEVELFDGHGRTRRYLYDAASRALEAEADSKIRQFVHSPISLTLFACVTKGSRWDWTIEKATELGVTRIVPVISARTIVRLPKEERAAKRERWLRIAEDAARQSDAVWLPEITEAMDFPDTLPLVKATRCFVGALTEPPPKPLLDAVLQGCGGGGAPAPNASGRSATQARSLGAGAPPPPQSLALYVGPEGDFTPDELVALLAIATPTSFGPTVLRAETAAIFGVSVLAAALHFKTEEKR